MLDILIIYLADFMIITTAGEANTLAKTDRRNWFIAKHNQIEFMR